MAEDNEQSKGFQVKDRRRFTETGEARDDAASVEEPSSQAADAKPDAAPQRPSHEREPLEITLSTFVMSLSTQALMCLGEIPNPLTDKMEPDLDAVRVVDHDPAGERPAEPRAARGVGIGVVALNDGGRGGDGDGLMRSADDDVPLRR